MPLRDKVEPVSLLELPVELHTKIIDNLSFPDNVNMKRTCKYFRGVIVFEHDQQIEAELSIHATRNGLYACVGCSRLRLSHKAKRRRGGPDATKRFCVECGTASPGEWTVQGYSPGAHIQVQGEHHVVCLDCKRFARGKADSRGKRTRFCHPCGMPREEARVAFERRTEELRVAQERARLKKVQARRREARLALWGSDYEDSDDDPEPGPTWSEYQSPLFKLSLRTNFDPSTGSE